MTETADATRSVVLERDLPQSPEKVWRALTEAHLIDLWLMKNDFRPVAGYTFTVRTEPMPGWNGITDCVVLTVEPHRQLSYSWNASGDEAADGLKSVVTWTLTPVGSGTRLRLEHRGFRPENAPAYTGAGNAWPRFLENLERVLAGLEVES